MSRAIRFGLIVAIAAAFAMAIPSAHADGHGSKENKTDKPTVLITGANRGLGLEFAKQYAADGWHVIGTARKPDGAEDLIALDVEVAQLDVADADSIAALAQSLEGRSIDMLINNAGIFPRAGSIDDVDFDDYMQTLVVNTVGPVRVTRALLPHLRKGDKKTIVNISSRLGSIELTTSGVFYGYRESKAALNMFTKTLAVELQPEGFTCLTVHPGWVQTDMGGANANLTPEESISGMRATIEKLGPAETGTYWSYAGEEVPW